MLIVRPIEEQDFAQLYSLTQLARAGLTSLPHDRELLARKIKASIRCFYDLPDRPGGETYLFVMEDPVRRQIVGTSAIYAKVGGFEPFYTYQIVRAKKSSELLNVHYDVEYLQLVKNHNGPTEIGSLFLAPEYRQRGNGRLLSLTRFLFMAEFAQCFENEVIAEMRGVIDEQDRSPFWEALGKHFFRVQFKNADMMVLRDKSFIAELMPEFPIYVNLLPVDAQAVINQVHANTRPAMQLLKEQGFAMTGEIDIFEAGPVVQATLSDIQTVRNSQRQRVAAVEPELACTMPALIANVTAFHQFRAVRSGYQTVDEGIVLSTEAAESLDVKPGGIVRYVPLTSRKDNS